MFLVAAYVAGAATGIFVLARSRRRSPTSSATSPVAGTAVATFQMMADFGSIGGSLLVGLIAQYTSYGWAFLVSGVILAVAAVGWIFAPETRPRPSAGHTHGAPVGSRGRRRSALTCDFERPPLVV